MKIEQKAGKVTITAWTDSSPTSINVEYQQWNGDIDTFRMRPEHLHDLRYCIDRVLAQIKDASPATGRK
jgi:hypothetical protein